MISAFSPPQAGRYASGEFTIRAKTPVSKFDQPRIIRVKRTHGFFVAYVPIQGQASCQPNSNGQGCLQALRFDPIETQQNSDQFIVQTYPLAVDDYTSGLGTSFTGAAGTSSLCKNVLSDHPTIAGVDNAGILSCDLLTAWVNGIVANSKTVSNSFSSNFLGIVPLNYFDLFSNLFPDGIVGVTPVKESNGKIVPSIYKVSLMTEGFWEIGAHEIAHTYGIDDISDNAVEKLVETPTGFKFINNVNIVRDFMGTNGCKPGVPIFNSFQLCKSYRNLSDMWISSSTFSTLFEDRFDGPTDPQVIVIAALVGQDGTVAQFPTLFIPEGIATPDDPNGDSAINLLDDTGSVVSQTRFSFANTLVGTEGVSVPLKTSFFLVSAPLTSNASTVQIVRQGTVLKEFNPNSQLLIDAINAIPDSSFNNNPKATRANLLKLAQNIEQRSTICKNIRSHKTNDDGEIRCLNHVVSSVLDLRETIERDLNDSIEKTTPLQMIKAEVLRTVDKVVLQTVPNRTVIAGNHEIRIRIFPEGDDRDDQGGFNIVSFTQGTNGSVKINRDGTITYRPIGAVQTDNFTITLQDAEKDTAVKTIHVIASATNQDQGMERDRNREMARKFR